MTNLEPKATECLDILISLFKLICTNPHIHKHLVCSIVSSMIANSCTTVVGKSKRSTTSVSKKVCLCILYYQLFQKYHLVNYYFAFLEKDINFKLYTQKKKREREKLESS